MDQDLAMRFGNLDRADLLAVLEFLLPKGALETTLVNELQTKIQDPIDVRSIKLSEI